MPLLLSFLRGRLRMTSLGSGWRTQCSSRLGIKSFFWMDDGGTTAGVGERRHLGADPGAVRVPGQHLPVAAGGGGVPAPGGGARLGGPLRDRLGRDVGVA